MSPGSSLASDGHLAGRQDAASLGTLKTVPNSVLTLFEHEAAPAGLPDPVVEGLVALRLNGHELFVPTARSFRATSFVGVVQRGNYVVQVLPKMYHRSLEGGSRSEKVAHATANLLFLLAYTEKLEVSLPEIARLDPWRSPLSELLYWLFAHQLWDAAHREPLRGYVEREERLGVIRGRWLVARQLRRPDSWRGDLFDVLHEEFTANNPPNRLLKATVGLVSRWAKRGETQKALSHLRMILDDVSEAVPQPGDFSRAERWMDRYRWCAKEKKIYRAILNLAQVFWQSGGWQWKVGPSQGFVWMFDMNQLFEEFVAAFIRRHLGERLRAWEWKMYPQRGDRYLLWDQQQGTRCLRLIPDIRFENAQGETALVIDTKYKMLNQGEQICGVQGADVYQMFAYKERYNCPRVILLYPQDDAEVRMSFADEPGARPWLYVYTVNLQRDFLQAREREALMRELSTILQGEEVVDG